jgi:phosphomannomutase
MSVGEIALAERWLELDPTEPRQAALAEWLRAGEIGKISAVFAEPLTFGTAGLRGAVGPGPARMNGLTVRGFAQALGAFLSERRGRAAVVVGYDARPESEEFAQRVASELMLFGHTVHWLDGPNPTPCVAYLVRRLSAQAGVVVTASHNPRGDAGLKVYDDLGIQIAPPWDTAIAERMGGASALGWIERLEASSQVSRGSAGSLRAVAEQDLAGYFSWIVSLSRQLEASSRPLRVAYTPLSGVGFAAASKLASELKVELLVPASEQDADGTFPHLPFPNPEEKGVLDEVLGEAARQGCDLAVANDPDADRCALALPDAALLPPTERASMDPASRELASSQRGYLAMVSGDELGVLLADAWLEALGLPMPLVVTTLVSSPAIEPLVAHFGGELRRTLTGFKWICRAANEDTFAFAYEEALGYCFGKGPERPVLDKDGLAALSVLIGLARREGARRGLPPGHALRARLQEVAFRDGLWVSAPRQVRAHDEASRIALFSAPARLREDPPRTVGTFRVERVLDYLGQAAHEPFAGRQDLLSFELSHDGGHRARVHVRPSGTEAKLKFYVHVGCRLSGLGDYALVQAELRRVAHELGTALLERLGLRDGDGVL